MDVPAVDVARLEAFPLVAGRGSPVTAIVDREPHQRIQLVAYRPAFDSRQPPAIDSSNFPHRTRLADRLGQPPNGPPTNCGAANCSTQADAIEGGTGAGGAKFCR